MRYLSENKREDMRMKKRTAARSMAALMGAAMVLTACGGGNTTAPTTGASSGGETQTASESAESGKITKTDIVVGQASDIVTLDPAGQQDTTSGVLMKHAYSTLLDVDNEGKVVPDLAESYEMKSDTEYVFKLREDACFWDGTPVTAQDVKFSLDRAKGMPKTKSNTSKIEEVTVNGDHEVTIKLTEPYAAFKTIVTQHNLSILSEKAVTEAGDSYGDVDNLLGSGPFKVTEWVPNDHYTLVRNDNYWGEMPIATSITCRVIPEGSARTIALEAGEIDVVWSVDPTDCANVESNPDVKLLSQPSTGIDYVGMNTQKEKFSDKRVRQAINYALDKQTFVDTIIEGRGLVANSYINAAIPGWTDEVEAYPYDPEKAKQLFDEAMSEEGLDKLTLTMHYSDTELMAQMSEFLQQSWPKLFGADRFELKLQAMPANQLSQVKRGWQTNPASYELSWGGWVGNDLAPWNAFKYWTSFYSNKNEPFINEEFDKVFNAANFADDRFDEGVRLKEVAEMERLLIEPANVIPVTQDIYKYLKADRLQLSTNGYVNRIGFAWDYSKIIE